jgi:hypothetical protein
MLPLPTWISALIPPYMATLILPLPFLVTTFRPPNKDGGNVVTWSTDGRLKAKLGGSRLNKLNRYGRGNTDLILVSLGNIVKVEVSEGTAK